MIRASDARAWTECPRRAWYLHNPPPGMAMSAPGAMDTLIEQLGMRHEWSVKRNLEHFYQVVEAVSENHTQTLMQAKVEVIYQPKLSKNGVVGWPDFLILHSSGEYQPADAKLARDEGKKPIQIQLGIYRRLLGTSLPAKVFLGNGETAEIGEEANTLVDRFLEDMQRILSRDTPPPARYSESKCKTCSYDGICKPEFERKRDITLIYGVSVKHAVGLEAQGLDTIEKLAAADPAAIKDIPFVKGHEAKQRIVAQAKSYLDGEIRQLKPLHLPHGTWVHFDIEANPLTQSGEEHVYLWGLLKPPYTGRDAYEYIWTDHEQQGRIGWEAFLATVARYRQIYKNLILAHYHHYEITHIRRYAERYDMQDHPVVQWLLGEDTPLFDLCKLVTECLVLPISSYSLKVICKDKRLVNFQWADADSGSQWSVVQFVNYLSSLIPSDRERIKRDILTYNYDDVVATRKLEEWLRKAFI